MHDKIQRCPPSLRPLPLLLCGIAEHQHQGREHVVGQVKQLPVDFIMLHNISDIAGTDPQALRGGHRVLGGDGRILHRQEEISRPRFSRAAASQREGLIPFLKVRAEHQHHLSPGNKWLMVAGIRQLFL